MRGNERAELSGTEQDWILPTIARAMAIAKSVLISSILLPVLWIGMDRLTIDDLWFVTVADIAGRRRWEEMGSI